MTFDEFKKAATVNDWDHTQKGTVGSKGRDYSWEKFTLTEYVTLHKLTKDTRHTVFTIAGTRTSATDFLTQLAEVAY